MIKRRFKKDQILKALQKYEEGMSIYQIITEYGISQATFYNWRSKYASVDASNTQEINKLKEDNDRLKRMFADISLENLSLKVQLEKHHQL